MRDNRSNIKVVPVIEPGVHSGKAEGKAVDTAGYDSLTFVVAVAGETVPLFPAAAKVTVTPSIPAPEAEVTRAATGWGRASPASPVCRLPEETLMAVGVGGGPTSPPSPPPQAAKNPASPRDARQAREERNCP